MHTVLTITAPIFLLILIGYLGVRRGMLPAEALPGMSRFVLYFALPSLVYSKISQMNLGELVDPQYLIAYALGCVASLVTAVLLSRVLFGGDWAVTGIHGLGSSLPNSAFIGFPVIMQFFEHPPTQAFAMAVMVENIILFPLVLILIESLRKTDQTASGTGKVIGAAVKRVVTNPIIIAVTAGIVTSAFSLSLPPVLGKALDLLAQGAGPVALVIIGGSLVGTKIRGDLKQIGLVASVKLLVHPLLVFMFATLLFPDMDPVLKTAAILFAAVPMLSIYPIIGSQYDQRSFCASTLLITTTLSFVTLSTLLHFLTLN